MPVGIRCVKNVYTARITRKGKQYHIGSFTTLKEAEEAYNTFKSELSKNKK